MFPYKAGDLNKTIFHCIKKYIYCTVCTICAICDLGKEIKPS